MPLRLYKCLQGHETEELYRSEYPQERSCTRCGGLARYRPSSPTFFMAGDRAPIDTAKEAWGGTALEGCDGKNQTLYESTSVQVDLGQHRPPPITKPVDPVDRMLGIK